MIELAVVFVRLVVCLVLFGLGSMFLFYMAIAMAYWGDIPSGLSWWGLTVIGILATLVELGYQGFQGARK